MVTYRFKNLQEMAEYFEDKAKQSEKIASTAGPQIKFRFTHEAAAYYDVVNILRNTKIGADDADPQ